MKRTVKCRKLDMQKKSEWLIQNIGKNCENNSEARDIRSVKENIVQTIGRY
jgi:hypothetical protein